jgi:hypothetical protein
MKEGIFGFIAVIGVLIGLSFLSYAGYSYFAPRYTAVDNKVFHESAQYNDGMVRDLENITSGSQRSL